jgi:hypothetical protein
MNIKYITFNTGSYDSIVIFPKYTKHSEIGILGTILGAGFIEVVDGKWVCFGESVSLKTKSRPEDTIIANKFIGLT